MVTSNLGTMSVFLLSPPEYVMVHSVATGASSTLPAPLSHPAVRPWSRLFCRGSHPPGSQPRTTGATATTDTPGGAQRLTRKED